MKRAPRPPSIPPPLYARRATIHREQPLLQRQDERSERPSPSSENTPPANLGKESSYPLTRTIQNSREGIDSSTLEYSGILQKVTPGMRAKILREQREAAFRRRRSQLQFGSITRADGPRGSTISVDPHKTPTARRFSAPKREGRIQPTKPESVLSCDVESRCYHGSTVERADVVTPNNQMKTFLMNAQPQNVLPCNVRTHCCDGDTEKTCLDAPNQMETLSPQPQNVTPPCKVEPRCDDSSLDTPNQTQTFLMSPQPQNILPTNVVTRCCDGDTERTNHNPPDQIETLSPQPQNVLSCDVKTRHDSGTERTNLDTPNQMKTFLMSPCPKNAGVIQCTVKRNRSGKNKLFPEYSVYLKEGGTFLMTSKKRANKKTSNYLISMNENDHDKSSKSIIGKLRANFLGTEFQIYDSGKNPRHADTCLDENDDEIVRSELGVVLYTRNMMVGSRGPRKMQVCVNKVDEDGNSLRKWQPVHKDEEMLSCFKHRIEPAMHHLSVFENKPPRWNEQLGAYVLNFNGRVTMASVKNFQLTEKGHDENVILQFGRVGKDEFTMDLQWPMSPMQGFAIALSSLDSKIACD